jgi:hypothetical protein
MFKQSWLLEDKTSEKEEAGFSHPLHDLVRGVPQTGVIINRFKIVV